MGSINDGVNPAWEFIRLGGVAPEQAATVRLIKRAGVDGARGRLEAKDAPLSRWIGDVDTINVGAAEARRVALSLLAGSVVTVIDDHGTEFTHVLCVSAAPVPGSKRVGLSAVGGLETSTNRVLLTFEFWFQFTEI